eukprot:jgi/Mesen1/1335/ME000013S00830
MEVVSPMLMMALLVYGWSLSDVSHYDAGIYANATLPVLSRIQEVVDHPQEYLQKCLSTTLVQEALLKGSVASPLAMWRLASIWRRPEIQGLLTPAGGLNSSALRQLAKDPAELQAALREVGAALRPQDELDPAIVRALLQCLGLLADGGEFLRSTADYSGPTPVPSFQTFVSAHKLVRLAMTPV